MIEAAGSGAALEPKPKGKFSFDWEAISKSPAFKPGLALVVGLFAAFWGLVSSLPNLWLNDEYYSHGLLVPVMIGYVIHLWWPRLREIPVKPAYWALIFFAPVAYLTYVATVNEVELVIGFAFLAAMLVGILFVGGLRWLAALVLPILYMAFALPLWQPIVDNYTNKMQVISAKVSEQLLHLFGLDPLPLDATRILVGNFQMDVGVPCSGLKLVIALMAFTIFFVMVGGLKWWGNLLMLISSFPLAIFINGLRIALIGFVGSQWGDEAGHKFHDYSGYITLVVCFILLFKFAKLLGWKD
jgi:exosortase